MSGTVRYGPNSRSVAIISRNGDLLGDSWLEVVMTKSGLPGSTFYPAENLIRSITCEIGGQQIDRVTSTWYRIYDNIYRTNNTDRAAYRRMVDFVDGEVAGAKKRFFVPVLMWFSLGSPGSYIPLLSIQYHELRLTFEFEDAANIPGIDGTVPLEATLWCDYVYLDQAERKKVSSQSSEYLLLQTQFTGDENVQVAATSKSQQVRLNFNHPTKFISFVVADPATHGKFTGGYAGATQEALAPLQSARLVLNGHDRAETRVGAYFNKIVPYQLNRSNPDAGIYTMAFSLTTGLPPAGSLNFSRIDSAVLALTFKAASVAGNTTVKSNVANVLDAETTTITDAQNLTALRTFAVSYNVLRILSGMAGLAYSN